MAKSSKTMLFTLHELGSVLSGQPVMCVFDDDSEGLLRSAGAPLNPDSLAEKRAFDEDLPIISITQEDVRSLLRGGTVITHGPDGRLLARLMTAEEFMQAHLTACEKVGMLPSLTIERARELTQTFGGEA